MPSCISPSCRREFPREALELRPLGEPVRFLGAGAYCVAEPRRIPPTPRTSDSGPEARRSLPRQFPENTGSSPGADGWNLCEVV